jgi:hypothetical protein
MSPLARILLIVSGGIAAYKSLELIRRGRDRGLSFRVILTHGGAEFVTPLSFASISGEKVYQELFSLTDEAEMGHIRLSREADLIVVAPAIMITNPAAASGVSPGRMRSRPGTSSPSPPSSSATPMNRRNHPGMGVGIWLVIVAIGTTSLKPPAHTNSTPSSTCRIHSTMFIGPLLQRSLAHGRLSQPPHAPSKSIQGASPHEHG